MALFEEAWKNTGLPEKMLCRILNDFSVLLQGNKKGVRVPCFLECGIKY